MNEVHVQELTSTRINILVLSQKLQNLHVLLCPYKAVV